MPFGRRETLRREERLPPRINLNWITMNIVGARREVGQTRSHRKLNAPKSPHSLAINFSAGYQFMNTREKLHFSTRQDLFIARHNICYINILFCII